MFPSLLPRPPNHHTDTHTETNQLVIDQRDIYAGIQMTKKSSWPTVQSGDTFLFIVKSKYFSFGILQLDI